MKINLISKEQYDTLLKIYSDHTALFLQNDGYQYLNKSKFTDADKKAFEVVTDILKEHVIGFSQFFNFRKSKNGSVELRFDYNYGASDKSMSFIGVGYILLDELLNGFEDSNPKN